MPVFWTLTLVDWFCLVQASGRFCGSSVSATWPMLGGVRRLKILSLERAEWKRQ